MYASGSLLTTGDTLTLDFPGDSPSGSAGSHVRADGQVLDV